MGDTDLIKRIKLLQERVVQKLGGLKTELTTLKNRVAKDDDACKRDLQTANGKVENYQKELKAANASLEDFEKALKEEEKHTGGRSLTPALPQIKARRGGSRRFIPATVASVRSGGAFNRAQLIPLGRGIPLGHVQPLGRGQPHPHPYPQLIAPLNPLALRASAYAEHQRQIRRALGF